MGTTTFIYTLSDPSTNLIRYVGKTNNINSRYRSHYYKCANESSHKRNWINKLKLKNLKPVIEIIDEVSVKDWQYWESYWIEQMRQWGFNLTNNTIGGDGLAKANQTSFKKGNIPWNKGKSNYKLNGEKSSTAVLQFDLQGNFIKEHLGCKEASQEVNCIPENIRRCCVGKSKTAKKFIWIYKSINKL